MRLWCEHLTLGLGGQEGHGQLKVTCTKGTEKASLYVAQHAMCQINQGSSFLKKKKIKISPSGPRTLLSPAARSGDRASLQGLPVHGAGRRL